MCEDSPTGRHEFEIDLSYDPSGNTINCIHCGEPYPNNFSFPSEGTAEEAVLRLMEAGLSFRADGVNVVVYDLMSDDLAQIIYELECS